MKLNNINLKKVIPIAAIVIVLVIAIICLITCDNDRDTSTSTTTTEAEATDTSDIANNETTEEQTTANDTVKDETENNTLVSVENTSDMPDPQTTVENKTIVNNQSTTKKPQSTYKPNNNEKETTTKNNTVYNPTIPQPTTTKNNYSNEEQQTTGNNVVEVGYGLYETIEEERVNEETNWAYYRTIEYYAWYEKYADGTIKMNDDKDYMLPQYIDSISCRYDNEGNYSYVSVNILDYYSYKYNGKFTGVTGKKSKELYNKYYKEEYAEVTIDEEDNYYIECTYYIDNKTNKTYDTYEEVEKVIEDRYINDIITQLGINNTNMSREKKIYLLLDYLYANWDIVKEKVNYNKYKEEIAVTFLDKIGIKAITSQYRGVQYNNYTHILAQMEDELWYAIYIDTASHYLHIEIVTSDDYNNLPSYIKLATSQTMNLVYSEYTDEYGCFIPADKLTH